MTLGCRNFANREPSRCASPTRSNRRNKIDVRSVFDKADGTPAFEMPSAGERFGQWRGVGTPSWNIGTCRLKITNYWNTEPPQSGLSQSVTWKGGRGVGRLEMVSSLRA